MPMALRACVLGFILLAAGGCKLVEPQSAGKSPLSPLSVSPDTITLEVFSAPGTHDDPEFAELWKLVDEQPLPAELRRGLAANGMRAGLVGPDIPGVLAAALKVSDRRIEDDERQSVPMDPDDGVTLRVLHARSGRRLELAIPHVRDEISLLESLDGQTQGKTYRQAECRLALRAYAEKDGSVRLALTPELHHGEFKSRVRGNSGDGMYVWTQEREKRILDNLKLEPTLAAGQMLVVTCRPDQPSTAGYHFFTDASGDKPVPMLWVFRVARAAHDRAFVDGTPDDEMAPVSNDQEE